MYFELLPLSCFLRALFIELLAKALVACQTTTEEFDIVIALALDNSLVHAGPQRMSRHVASAIAT